MSSSTRGPQRGTNSPFVMHLERVCRLIEMGQRFTVEFNPTSDVAAAGVTIVQDIRIRIREGGGHPHGGIERNADDGFQDDPGKL